MDVEQGLLGNGRHQPRPPPEALDKDTLESVGRLSGKRQTKEEDQRPWRELQRFEPVGGGSAQSRTGIELL